LHVLFSTKYAWSPHRLVSDGTGIADASDNGGVVANL
jgi:hypothetical protein